MTAIKVGACVLLGCMALLVGMSLLAVAKMVFGDLRDAKGFDRVAIGVVFVILLGAGLALGVLVVGFGVMMLGSG